MSRKPTLEIVDDDDIDNMDMDIAQFDPNLRTPVAPILKPTVVRSQDQGNPFPTFAQQNIPVQSQSNEPPLVNLSEDNRKHIAKFQIIYPCYFDVTRSHNDGRRVSEARAVFNPLAKTISDACVLLGVPVVLEYDKTHPQDIGNPGRVRVLIKEEDRVVDKRFQNKRVLLNAIAEFLQKHTTTLSSIKKGTVVPPGYESFQAEELPLVRGFKMNTIVPVHSRFTLKHPMTANIYELGPKEEEPLKAIQPKVPKKKIMRMRG